MALSVLPSRFPETFPEVFPEASAPVCCKISTENGMTLTAESEASPNQFEQNHRLARPVNG
jgi:hypothetical protein